MLRRERLGKIEVTSAKVTPTIQSMDQRVLSVWINYRWFKSDYNKKALLSCFFTFKLQSCLAYRFF